jgi:hypothetical protein
MTICVAAPVYSDGHEFERVPVTGYVIEFQRLTMVTGERGRAPKMAPRVLSIQLKQVRESGVFRDANGKLICAINRASH